MPFNSAQKVQISFVRYATMNNKHFVVYYSCNRKKTEHILKELQDFPAMSLVLLHDFSGESISEVHDVVLMVSPVQMHVVGVEQNEGKENDDNLCRFLSSIHKVSIEYVGVFRRGQTVLVKYKQQVIQSSMQIATDRYFFGIGR